MPATGNGPALADVAGKADVTTHVRRRNALLKAGALQNAILTSANFSIIATDESGAGGLVLVRRAIEPGYGKWVFPGGFVDRGETLEEAAARETREEVGLEVATDGLLGAYSYREYPVVVVVYAARVTGGCLMAGDEALEAKTFAVDRLPWDDLAFASTKHALTDYVKNRIP